MPTYGIAVLENEVCNTNTKKRCRICQCFCKLEEFDTKEELEKHYKETHHFNLKEAR